MTQLVVYAYRCPLSIWIACNVTIVSGQPACQVSISEMSTSQTAESLICSVYIVTLCTYNCLHYSEQTQRQQHSCTHRKYMSRTIGITEEAHDQCYGSSHISRAVGVGQWDIPGSSRHIKEASDNSVDRELGRRLQVNLTSCPECITPVARQGRPGHRVHDVRAMPKDTDCLVPRRDLDRVLTSRSAQPRQPGYTAESTDSLGD